jgi:hypothetical protein
MNKISCVPTQLPLYLYPMGEEHIGSFVGP